MILHFHPEFERFASFYLTSFQEIREKNGLEHSQDLSSLVIKPVQRITRYRLMLEQLLKNCKNNVDEIRVCFLVFIHFLNYNKI